MRTDVAVRQMVEDLRDVVEVVNAAWSGDDAPVSAKLMCSGYVEGVRRMAMRLAAATKERRAVTFWRTHQLAAEVIAGQLERHDDPADALDAVEAAAKAVAASPPLVFQPKEVIEA